MNDVPEHDNDRARGIYLLPNLFTTGAMFCGFYAIVSGINQHFITAAIAVFIAALLDSMDGRVARLTNTQTDFGVQYDSLSDLVSFGVAPALVMYSWALRHLHDIGPAWGKLGWTAAFIYAACTALRLARFNTQVGEADKRYFQGLPCPAGAALCMAMVWAMEKNDIHGQNIRFTMLFMAIAVGLLMVSRIRYFSFKTWPIDGNDKISFVWAIVAVLVLVLLAINTSAVLLTAFGLYVLSGPVMTIAGRYRA